ncbi:MAG TPA: hypothetical protein VIT02_03485 [Burkholderiaceae bacterium]
MNRLLASALFAGATALSSTPVLAQDLGWSVSIGSNGQASVTIGNVPFVTAGPVYFPNPPAVHAPAHWPLPVYAPPPVVFVPRPIVIRPPHLVRPLPWHRAAPGHRHRFDRDDWHRGQPHRHRGPHSGGPRHWQPGEQRGKRWQ